MAKAGGTHPDRHVARRRIADRYVLDDQRGSGLVQHGGAVS